MRLKWCAISFRETISLSLQELDAQNWRATCPGPAEHDLDEHKIPDLQHIGIVFIDHVSGVSSPYPVIVDLCARPTWALIAHLPEVVFGAKWQDSLLGQELQPAKSDEG